MSIENNSKCDECRTFLGERDECYCGKCVAELKEEIDTLQGEIRDLQKRIEELEEAFNDKDLEKRRIKNGRD